MTVVTSDTGDVGMTVDELGRSAGVPVRTIREYQTMGLVPHPRRVGRVAHYDSAHLGRLRLIGRLQQRGYSLAGIADLLAAWSGGDGLAEVLGLEPDELVHVTEPGAPVSLEQLALAVPDLVPAHLDRLVATAVVEACGPDRYCVPSPSLLQLTADTLAAGLGAQAVLTMLDRLREAADTVTDAVLTAVADLPDVREPESVERLVVRGRGLLAHGVGRLALHRLGRRMGATDDATTGDLAALLGRARGPGE